MLKLLERFSVASKSLDRIFAGSGISNFLGTQSQHYYCSSSTAGNTPKAEILKDIPGIPVWLRHHCRCSLCYNYRTRQRKIIPSSLRGTAVIKSVEKIRESCTGQELLKITWIDEHISTFSSNWLAKYLAILEAKDRKQELRSSSHSTPVETSRLSTPSLAFGKAASESPLDIGIPYGLFMEEDTALKELLRNIDEIGYGVLVEAPATGVATEAAISPISHVQNTIFGGFWQFEANMAHPDSAYSKDYVHSHTDTSYFSEPAGLQVFHCLMHDGDGGFNSLVDGYQVAEQILNEFPKYYQVLRNTPLPWEYIEEGVQHFRSVAPIFHHNPYSGQLECVRYNPHDLGIVETIGWSAVPELYDCLVYLSEKIEGNLRWFKLQPGTILLINNWRMLHGRNEFSGRRKLCGAYVSRSDLLSRSRVLLHDPNDEQ